MRKLILTVVIISVSMFLSADFAKAQVVIKVKPAKPKVAVVKHVNKRSGYVWVDGHWKWSAKRNKYLWVDGYWAKKKKGHKYVQGHWAKAPGGHKWVPGHWKRV